MPGSAAVAVDIGGTTTKIAVVRDDGSVGPATSFPTQGPAEVFLEALTSRLAAFGKMAIGVSVAGFVNDAQSAMVYNPNIPWLQGVPLRAEIAARTGRDVRAFDADSNAAAYAEYVAGAGLGSRRFLCISIGTGVGGGMIVDGEIVRLAWGGLGDIGHVIVDRSGPSCPAGCRGCAEAVVSAPAIEARWPGDDRLPLREIIDRARAGAADAVDVLARAGESLAVALASYAAILFPDTIAVAGGVAEAGDLLLRPARETVERLTGPFYRRDLKIVKAVWGWQAPLAGAGLMALRPYTSRR